MTGEYVKNRSIIIAIVAIFSAVLSAVIMLVIAFGSDNNEINVSKGNISVVNNIDTQPSISVFNMFVTPDEIAADKETCVLQKSDDSGRGYLNNCAFLGDSRTVAMVSFACINDDDALAQIGISHMQFKNNRFVNNAGKEYTLSSYLDSHQKPVIYISLGVNGMNGISDEDYEKSYTELVDYVVEKAPNSSVVLMSIWPVDDGGRYSKTVQNSWISKYNEFLYNLAKEKKLYFLNINEILTSQNGQIKSEYDAGDGLHYNNKAYEAIMEYIISHPVPGVSHDGDYTVKYIPPRHTPSQEETEEEPMNDDALMQLYEQMLNGNLPEGTEQNDASMTDGQGENSSQENIGEETNAGQAENIPQDEQGAAGEENDDNGDNWEEETDSFNENVDINNPEMMLKMLKNMQPVE